MFKIIEYVNLNLDSNGETLFEILLASVVKSGTPFLQIIITFPVSSLPLRPVRKEDDANKKRRK